MILKIPDGWRQLEVGEKARLKDRCMVYSGSKPVWINLYDGKNVRSEEVIIRKRK